MSPVSSSPVREQFISRHQMQEKVKKKHKVKKIKNKIDMNVSK